MIKIRKVNNSEKQIINQVVDIHLSTFTGFFLSFMGKGFLKQMYTSYCEHSETCLMVAEDEDLNIIGFLGYSCNMSSFYKYMIKKRILQFAWYSIGAFFRKPKIFIRLLRAFLKPSESKREEEYVELASIGVKPEYKHLGVGSKLISELKDNIDFSKYEYIALETDAIDNDVANNFYIKNGFNLANTYMTREGRKMNEYRFYGEI